MSSGDQITMLRAEASAVDGRKLTAILALNWMWLVLIPVLAAVVGYAISARQADVYESEATLLIQPTAAQVRLGQDTPSDRELDTQEALLNGVVIENLVKPEIGESVTFRAEREFGTDLIFIIASGPSQAAADAGATAVGNVYLSERATRERLELDAAIEALSAPIAQLEARLDMVNTQILAAGGAEQVGSSLLSQRDALVAELSEARRSAELLRVEAAVTTGGARLLAPATGAGSPVAPRPARSAVIWFVVGVVVAIGAIWLREQFDDGLLSPPELDDQ